MEPQIGGSVTFFCKFKPEVFQRREKTEEKKDLKSHCSFQTRSKKWK